MLRNCFLNWTECYEYSYLFPFKQEIFYRASISNQLQYFCTVLLCSHVHHLLCVITEKVFLRFWSRTMFYSFYLKHCIPYALFVVSQSGPVNFVGGMGFFLFAASFCVNGCQWWVDDDRSSEKNAGFKQVLYSVEFIEKLICLVESLFSLRFFRPGSMLFSCTFRRMNHAGFRKCDSLAKDTETWFKFNINPFNLMTRWSWG